MFLKARSESKQSVVHKIEDPKFWYDLEIALNFLEPVKNLITKCESDESYVENTYLEFQMLKEHFRTFEQDLFDKDDLKFVL